MKRRSLLPFAPSIMVALILGSIIWVQAGSLSPPPGPVAPTMKPLTDLEPRIAINAANTPGDASNVFKIVNPGSYYLTANLTAGPGQRGILVAANHVQIDLNGFILIGVGGSLNAIDTNGVSLTNMSVCNGTITGFSNGIDASSSEGARIENIEVAGCSGFGITGGQKGFIHHCVAKNNGQGIVLSIFSKMSDCVVSSNTGHGIVVAGSSCLISNCQSNKNSGTGIYASVGGQLESCSCDANVGSGFNVDGAAVVRNCSAGYNSGDGISAGAKCVITGCNLHQQTANGMAGLLITGSFNRVEDNHAASNYYGIKVTGSANVVIRNSAGNSTSTDYSIAPANPLAAPSVTSLSSATPWSNLEY